MAKKGLIISFEGGEGGGKTTQIVRLRDRLVAAGKDVIAVREPGGTAVGEQIREVVLSSKNTGISFTAEVLLFQAARAQIYREIVAPSLKAGKIVLMDRTRDSSVVYQGVVRKFGKELIEQLNNISTQNTYPDITFLLDVPVEMGLDRRAKTGEVNRLDMEAKNFHDQVRKAYLDLAKEDKSGRWIVIDAKEDLENVQEAIWTEVEKRLKNLS
jgi:dTMP kinase